MRQLKNGHSASTMLIQCHSVRLSQFWQTVDEITGDGSQDLQNSLLLEETLALTWNTCQMSNKATLPHLQTLTSMHISTVHSAGRYLLVPWVVTDHFCCSSVSSIMTRLRPFLVCILCQQSKYSTWCAVSHDALCSNCPGILTLYRDSQTFGKWLHMRFFKTSSCRSF